MGPGCFRNRSRKDSDIAMHFGRGHGELRGVGKRSIRKIEF
jgi:hypothetical protein